ncbi:CGNR zinc finger domain-containing protein [uncultured Phycicoccus sp.]|uniref:CGNR zinc finger domain-containing protein n=1 Tax=uncultured Phycicoccus sp. TaxID=661422 RepID=UPI002622DBCE|nr:CGNR zinc finger domain-containing protein [uncultured Phycicoccus sp.]
MTGQGGFDSHVLALVDVAARLVNATSPGDAGGHPVAAPTGDALRSAVAEALGGPERRTPTVTAAHADALAGIALRLREVFDAAAEGRVADAVTVLNDVMAATGARPQLDPLPDGGWHVHFHGTTDDLATGWAAGCAAGLALAVGSNLAGRLGVCAADRCDRVYVDVTKNSTRRFCSTACQNRTKAAAFRARRH